MIEQLVGLDRALFQLINGFGADWADSIMLGISSKWTPIPLYAALLYFIWKRFGTRWWIPVLYLVALAIISDQSSVHLFKDVFKRLRPCHNPALVDAIRQVGKCGGQFGFVSSHACNTAGLVSFFILTIPEPRLFNYMLILWAILVCWSRIYLGVHYPADVVAGAIWGVILGGVLYFGFSIWAKKWFFPQHK